MFPEIILDDWQRKLMNTEGNICLRSGRQVGKSTAISIKSAKYAMQNYNKTIMVVAKVERQALLLFEKILSYIYFNDKKLICKGKKKPTKHKLELKNGSVIHCLPVGESGYGIRGFTIDLLIADEAAFIPEDVWAAITPMLAITKGDIWLLSTPCGKEGYFYRTFNDESFTNFHISSEDCPRKNEKFLEQERKRMTRLQYAQEYLGEFVDDLRQFFPADLIDRCMTLKKKEVIEKAGGNFYLGVDIAHLGEDESTFITIEIKGEKLLMRDLEIMTKIRTTENVRKIISLDKKWNYKKIYLDDAGIGVGVFDQLSEIREMKRKVKGINNARRSIEKTWENFKERIRKKKLIKEDLYNNLLNLMERGKIEFLDEPEVYASLKSIQYEYTDEGNFKIFGSYTHVAEGLIRAAWAIKDKGLNIWVA